ncbi:hypothetical protein DFH94DRAFT_852183 [Russula ochroleuca]|uniref:Uncharacterized protein n=1 Tax=Russula ochroleuca TaxID=152965 RepID=A0A9P5N010_9AGAM|nr:hypothetical protein DFH94DRAFT_852183 [Russula ochroleuca]
MALRSLPPPLAATFTAAVFTTAVFTAAAFTAAAFTAAAFIATAMSSWSTSLGPRRDPVAVAPSSLDVINTLYVLQYFYNARGDPPPLHHIALRAYHLHLQYHTNEVSQGVPWHHHARGPPSPPQLPQEHLLIRPTLSVHHPAPGQQA